MQSVMQRVLRGEMPYIRVTIDHDPCPWAYGFGLRLEIWIDLVWWHYEDTHGLFNTPWGKKKPQDDFFAF